MKPGVYFGDCLDFLDKIDFDIELIVSDPPYSFIPGGLNLPSKEKQMADIKRIGTYEFNPAEIIPKILKKQKVINAYFFCNKTLILDYLNIAKHLNLKYDVLVMCKNTCIPAKNNHYLHDMEYIIYLKDSGAYFDNEQPFSYYSKWYNYTPTQNIHPNQKPIDLIRRLIAVSSKEGDVVFDPFLGSGTTVVAAKQLNRWYLGFEILPEYFNMTLDRLNQSNLKAWFDE